MWLHSIEKVLRTVAATHIASIDALFGQHVLFFAHLLLNIYFFMPYSVRFFGILSFESHSKNQQNCSSFKINGLNLNFNILFSCN